MRNCHIYTLVRPTCPPHMEEITGEFVHIHLFQKTLSERTANGSCWTEIVRPQGTVVSIFGMQKQWVLCVRWTRELKQSRRRRQQKPHKFAYWTMKNRIFARFARAFFSFWHFEDVLVLSTTSNDLFFSSVDDVSLWWQMFNFVFLCPKRWFQ